MLIEFIGLPGSGKTTLCGRLRTALTDAGCDVWTQTDYWKTGRIHAYARSFRDILGGIRIIRNVPWAHIVAMGGEHRGLISKSILVNIAEHSAVARRPGREIAVFDEGLVQRAYSIFVYRRPSMNVVTMMHRYIDSLKLPELLIHIKAPVSLALERICKRGVPHRMAGMSRDQMEAMLMRGDRLIEMVVDYVKTSARVLDVDAGEDDSSVRSIVASIDSCGSAR